MSYRAPVTDMIFAMRHVAGLDRAIAEGLYPDLSTDLVEAVLTEAGRYANDVLAPLNKVGDRHGTPFRDGRITMPPGWAEAYRGWAEAGWNSLPATPDYGGQGLPLLVNAACTEMWNAANMAFALGPLLTCGAIEALTAHGSQALKDIYLARLISGEWMATMNLTEPQAGSDLNALRTKAERAGDGSYRITGNKIFITYGEHDMVDNIVHLVLARLPDAPAGTRGISLFVVPKFLVNADGSPGARNDVRCHSIEHKMGVHASPTCTMVFGDNGGAVGYLVGEENRGLACMFTMMNNARLGVGLQGVAITERAYQQALWYANERKQGRAVGASGEAMPAGEMSPIIEHPGIQRKLMTMKALTHATRGICYQVAAALDRAHLATDEGARKAAHERASLLTPIAKAFSTDVGTEMAAVGVQVHGGMGFVEETGAAQHLRDAKIAQIYEGTNGIQAIDLVMRKIPLSGGGAVDKVIAEQRQTLGKLVSSRHAGMGQSAPRLREAIESFDRATSWMKRAVAGNSPRDALSAASPYLRLFGLVQGASCLALEALAAEAEMAAGSGDDAHRGRIALCRFYCEQLLTAAGGLEATVMTGGDSFSDARLALAG
jgi:butyryl-CoA dehydrogenase